MSALFKNVMSKALSPAARYLTAGSARVFMYHRFGPPGTHRRISADVLERQVRYLRKRYELVPLGTLVRMLASGEPLRTSLVSITVDDGYADFAEYAYPVFRKYDVPVTVYLVSGFVDRRLWLWFDALHYIASKASPGDYEVVLPGQVIRIKLDASNRHELWEAAAEIGVGLGPVQQAALIESFREQLRVDLPFVPTRDYSAMTWETVRSLNRNVVEWGGHTVSHPILSMCSADTQFKEISDGRKRIEEMIQRPIDSFCYPNGQPNDYDQRTVETVKRAGFGNAVVAHGGMAKPGCDPFLIERLGAPDGEIAFQRCADGIWEVRRRLHSRFAAARAAW